MDAVRSAVSPRAEQLCGSLRHRRVLILVSVVLGWLFLTSIQPQSRAAFSQLLPGFKVPAYSSGSLDVVLAYFEENIDNFNQQIAYVRSVPALLALNPRFIAYVKGDGDLEDFQRKTGVDDAYRLPNYGREGSTYLRHILHHYNYTLEASPSTSSHTYTSLQADTEWVPNGPVNRGLADWTLFLQAHLSWEDISEPRMRLFSTRTGFLQFAPYITMDCGVDGLGNGDFWRAAQIYTIFREHFCPERFQLGSYAAQFGVSRQRIMANSYNKYKGVLEAVEAPDGHWLHDEGRWVKGVGTQSNPFFGHALERSWPVIFGCTDPKIAEQCPDNVFDEERCQCFDR